MKVHIRRCISFVTIFFIVGCSNPFNQFADLFSSDKTFFRSDAEIVQIVDQDKNATPNQHPVKLNVARIEGALHLVLLKRSDTTFPLFNDKKRIILATTISKALQKAKPNEDIVFSIEDWYKDPREEGIFNTSKNYITSARVFFKKNTLNIIFGSIMRKGHMSDDPMIGRINLDYNANPYAPGSRNYSLKNDWILATPPNSGVFKPLEGKDRMDWLVFTIQALKPRGETTKRERLVARNNNIEVQGLRAELQQLRNELRQIRPQNQFVMPQYQYPQQYPYYPYPPQYQPPQTYSYPLQYQYPPGYQQQSYRSNSSIQNSPNSKKRQELENLRARGLISEEQFLEQLNKY